jgi:hypothetical protein
MAADGVEILVPDKSPFKANVDAMLAEYAASELGPLIRRIQDF